MCIKSSGTTKYLIKHKDCAKNSKARPEPSVTFSSRARLENTQTSRAVESPKISSKYYFQSSIGLSVFCSSLLNMNFMKKNAKDQSCF